VHALALAGIRTLCLVFVDIFVTKTLEALPRILTEQPIVVVYLLHPDVAPFFSSATMATMATTSPPLPLCLHHHHHHLDHHYEHGLQNYLCYCCTPTIVTTTNVAYNQHLHYCTRAIVTATTAIIDDDYR
ncbi:unnamed protein product, partial [Ectocarpus sp. 12 AP-2014]